METLVIKYGGNAIADTRALTHFAAAIARLQRPDRHIVIVHGGGPQINHWLKETRIESHFVDGQRYTDQAALDVVEMALCAHVNKAIVRALSAQEIPAAGISGEDGHLLLARPNPALGAVGHITHTNPDLIHTLLDRNYLPVIAPLGCDEHANALNINADYAAAHIAGALDAEQCLFMTNVDGLLDENGERIECADRALVEAMIADGRIYGGMIPKVQCALVALDQGVKQACIVNGLTMDALHAFDRGQRPGTIITP